MIRTIANSPITRGIAALVALNFVVEIFFPTAAMALTAGPSQPEASHFTPVGSSEMVDLFTGDFSYNLPLITVPGITGGYPINLAYQGGASMEQEATWVGLGWSLNPGSITRQMRGIPDEYRGDLVSREMHMKPNKTYGVGFSTAPVGVEVVGTDIQFGMDYGYTVYYNNFNGLGYKSGINFSTLSDEGTGPGAGLGLSYDSQTGLGVSPSLWYGGEIDDTGLALEAGGTFHSREGFSFQFKGDAYRFQEVFTKDGDFSGYMNGYTGKGPGLSFAKTAAVPRIDFPRKSNSYTLTIKGGGMLLGTTADLDLDLNYSTSSINQNKVETPAYGYLYDHERNPMTDMADFDREKDVPANGSSKLLPIPVNTYDIYNITGQGMGATVRGFRNTPRAVNDPYVYNTSGGGAAGFDANVGGSGANTEAKGGTNIQFWNGSQSSGPWSQAYGVVENTFEEGNKTKNGYDIDVADAFFDPVYFKAPGDLTGWNQPEQGLLASNKAQAYQIENSNDPFVSPLLADVNNQMESVKESTDQTANRRTQNIDFLTFEQLHKINNNLPTQILNSGGQPYAVGHHLGRVTVTQPGGQRYVYGKPQFNLHQQDANFSVEHAYTDQPNDFYEGNFTRFTQYEASDRSGQNNKGESQVFSEVTLPPYAHSYLLTEVLSADYIDADLNNTPSEADLGGWMKFNYQKYYGVGLGNGPYKWRTPYSATTRIANLNTGHYSNLDDDQGTFSYGEKELHFLQNIETRTHIAKFITSEREDGLGAGGVDGGKDVAQKLQKLDKIELYRKAPEGEELIQTVHFAYSYDLCGQVENNSNAQPAGEDHPVQGAGVNANENRGKLTLHKVWFTYGRETSNAQLSPYVFNYGERYTQEDVDAGLVSANQLGAINLDKNPNYNPNYMDRWGSYQEDDANTAPYLANAEHPYTNQQADFDGDGTVEDNATDGFDDVEKRNTAASVWNLRDIRLPSGGKIAINYEADDYAFVQEKQAMQMARITGTSSDPISGSVGKRIQKNDTYIYFELERPIADDANASGALYNYIKGINEVYFKTYQRLKKREGTYTGYEFPEHEAGITYDYVEGYAEIDIGAPGYYGFDDPVNGYFTTGYVKVKEVTVNDRDNGLTNMTHPFRKAGWQYLRLQRQDLFQRPNNLMGNVTSAMQIMAPMLKIVPMLTEATRMVSGFYQFAQISGFCQEMKLDGTDFKPSFLRLNTPDAQKYGGGSRVESVVVYDNWDAFTGESSYSYGTRYEYTHDDGSSSGVAAYEPMLGGEEIPHRLPVRYSTERFMTAKDKALYVEAPMGESYFPAPSVGYAKVTVKPFLPNGESNVTRSLPGYSVNEFYTAKDFPTRVVNTGVKELFHPKPVVTIPFIQNINRQIRGMSQGYSIFLNNMHGKPYSSATYAYNSAVAGKEDFVQAKTTYYYHAKPLGDGSYRLKSEVPVLVADGRVEDMDLGKTIDVITDTREDNAYSSKIGQSLNSHNSQNGPTVISILTMLPNISTSENSFRSVVNTKVIQQNGILDRVEVEKAGATIKTKNLAFDQETGKALLTRVNNTYGDPIYSYEMPAYWAYSGMRPAYTNAQANLKASALADLTALMEEGDVLMDITTGARYWVEDPEAVVLRDESGNINAPTSGWLRVIQSGRKNQTTVPGHTLVSLKNPIDDRIFPGFDGYNATLPANRELQNIVVEDCRDGSTKLGFFYYNTNNIVIEEVCENQGDVIIQFSEDLPTDIEEYDLTKAGQQVIATKTVNGQIVDELIGQFIDPYNCLPECLKGVLNTSATRFADEHTYDYSGTGMDEATTATHPYRYGAKGIYRPVQSFAYRTLREQRDDAYAYTNPGIGAGSNIRVDGTFESFEFFNPLCINDADQEPWYMMNEVVRYSPYGFDLESKDPLGIHSSALYGYDYQVPIAVAANCAYSEFGYDGFEDYGTATPSGHGHLNFQSTGTAVQLSQKAEAHTGDYSLKVAFGPGNKAIYQTGAPGYFLADAKDYHLSVWVKTDQIAKIRAVQGNNTLAEATTSSSKPWIDGWQRLEIKFTGNGSAISLELEAMSGDAWFDDIRVQPFQSTMKSYVYDPVTLRLWAELDANNYATFYNYDEDGGLIQTKKETERGVFTIATGRQNTVKLP